MFISTKYLLIPAVPDCIGFLAGLKILTLLSILKARIFYISIVPHTTPYIHITSRNTLMLHTNCRQTRNLSLLSLSIRHAPSNSHISRTLHLHIRGKNLKESARASTLLLALKFVQLERILPQSAQTIVWFQPPRTPDMSCSNNQSSLFVAMQCHDMTFKGSSCANFVLDLNVRQCWTAPIHNIFRKTN